jgi:methyl-accepting chemotaxis protein
MRITRPDTPEPPDFEAGEYKRLGKGGREVWIQASTTRCSTDGAPGQVVKIASDVTALKLHNAEFEAKVAAIDLGQAVIEFDLDGHVLTANRNFLAAMGYTLREIQNQHHSMFCSTGTPRAPYRDFWLAGGQLISGRFHRRQIQRDVWIQATYNPILDLNGKVMKVVKYAYDVTKEVELEKRIATRSTEMRESVLGLVQSIGAIASNSGLAATMAHDTSAAAQSGFEALQNSIAAIDAIQTSSARVPRSCTPSARSPTRPICSPSTRRSRRRGPASTAWASRSSRAKSASWPSAVRWRPARSPR